MNFALIARPLARLPDLLTDRRQASAAFRKLAEMASPRGRCNRKAFLNIALTFLGLQAAVAGLLWLLDAKVDQTGTILLNAPVLWIGTTICFKRLHDVGRSGWWLPGAAGIWFFSAIVVATVVSMILGAEALAEGQPAFFAMLAVIMLPAFSALLWLHTRASEPRANRFGPVPTGFGLSLPSQSRRSRAPRTYYAAAVLA